MKQRLPSGARTLNILLSGVFLLGAGSLAAAPREKYMGEKKATSLIIISNVKQVAITIDGLLAGNAGAAMDVEPGWNEMTLTAQGYATRLVKAFAKAGMATTVTVNMAKLAPSKLPNEVAALPKRSFREPKTIGPTCAALIGEPKKGQAAIGEAACALRPNWLDDVYYAGLGLPAQLSSKLATPAINAFFTKLRSALYARRVDAAWFQSAEQLVGVVPDDSAAFTSLVYGAILSGNCPRALQIGYEAQLSGLVDAHLATALALCHELGDDLKSATGLIGSALKRDTSAPEAFYHFGRISLAFLNSQVGDRPGAAFAAQAAPYERLLANCTGYHKTYFPCFDLLRASLGSHGNRERASLVLQGFTGKGWLDPEAHAGLAQEMLKRGEPWYAKAYLSSSLEVMPNSMELRFGLAHLDLASGMPVSSEAFAESLEGTKTKDVGNATKVLKTLEPFKRPDLLQRGFEAILAEEPTNNYTRWHLVRAYKLGKSFQRCVDSVNNLLEVYESNVIRGLYKLKAECLVGLGRFEDAANTYEILSMETPTDWRVFYNWGAALERAGQSEAAMEAWRKAIELGPPPRVGQSLKDRMNMYSRKTQGRGKQ